MCLFLRMTLAVMLMFAAITREGAAKEVLFNIEDGGADNEGVESREVKDRHIPFSPLPLCALETMQVKLDDNENMEYSPSTYTEVRCKKSGETSLSEQSCAFPYAERSYPPAGHWGSTTCLQRWDTVRIFRRLAGSNGRWQLYEEREVPSGCECVIMIPEIVQDEVDGPMVDRQEARMVPVALQHYGKSNRYGRSIEIEV